MRLHEHCVERSDGVMEHLGVDGPRHEAGDLVNRLERDEPAHCLQNRWPEPEQHKESRNFLSGASRNGFTMSVGGSSKVSRMGRRTT